MKRNNLIYFLDSLSKHEMINYTLSDVFKFNYKRTYPKLLFPNVCTQNLIYHRKRKHKVP